jgi:Tfp pilus assembly protein PilF
MALRRNQFEQARQHFAEAVELSPDEAEHQAMLAWSTWVAAGDARTALYPEVVKRFAQAIERSPRCVPAHFFRAMVAKQAGKDDVAIEGFRRVLELKSSHAEADLELRLLESRKTKKKK